VHHLLYFQLDLWCLKTKTEKCNQYATESNLDQ